ncbi:hypothetical protein Tco_0660336 [Tanacetum coccineum]
MKIDTKLKHGCLVTMHLELDIRNDVEAWFERIDEDNADGDVVMPALEEADVTQRARWKKSIERTGLAYNCYNF